MKNEVVWYQIDTTSDILLSVMSPNLKQAQFLDMEDILIKRNERFLGSLHVL